MIKYFEPRILLTQCDQAPNPYGLDPPSSVGPSMEKLQAWVNVFYFCIQF